MHRNASTCRHRTVRSSELLLASDERDGVGGGVVRKGTGRKKGEGWWEGRGGKGEKERKGGGRNFSLFP